MSDAGSPSPRVSVWPMLAVVALVAALVILALRRQQPAALSETAMKAQQDYLDRNAKQPGVEVRPSGLQIRHLTVGEGKAPGPRSEVTVHYRGSLIDGTVFDSSYERKEPISFPLDGVIAGWTEGLQLMKEGGKAELVIPAKLGYGARGAGGVIPPHATLIFEVELLQIAR